LANPVRRVYLFLTVAETTDTMGGKTCTLSGKKPILRLFCRRGYQDIGKGGTGGQVGGSDIYTVDKPRGEFHVDPSRFECTEMN